MLTPDQIRSAVDITTEKVPVPEWAPQGTPLDDAYVLVRGWTARERDEFEQSLSDHKKKGVTVNIRMIRVKAFIRSVVDESGQLAYSESDAHWLGSKSAAPLDRVFTVIQKLSGMSDNDVEDISKNLESIRAEGSTSGSPASSDAA